MTHQVKNGDTLYSIARQYQVKVDDILFLNGIDNPSKIYAGQKLRIPSGSIKASPAANNPAKTPVVEHKVAKGETLFGIARRYEVTVAALRAANNLSDNSTLKAGALLKIPVQNAAAVMQPAARTNPPAKFDENINWPFNPQESAYITGKLSPGMLLTGIRNEPVRSVSSGTVVYASPYRGNGRVVIVKSDSGYDYFYGGCESLTVRKGDRVIPGAEVGRLGVNTATSKPQLTFMVYHNNKAIDPAKAPRA